MSNANHLTLIEGGKQPSQYFFDLAIKADLDGKLHLAKDIWLYVIRISPDDHAAHCNLSTIYSRLMMFDKSLVHIKKAIELNPKNAIYQYNMGSTLQDLERNDEAENYYLQAITLNPEMKDAYYNLWGLKMKTDPALATQYRAMFDALEQKEKDDHRDQDK